MYIKAIILYVFVCIVSINSNYIPEDNVLFDIKWSIDDEPDILKDSITLQTPDRDQFTCYLKASNITTSVNTVNDQTIKSFARVFANIMSDSSYLYRESYFTFELRHGLYVRQFRVERENGLDVIKQEYFLGHYDMNQFKESLNMEDNYNFEIVKRYISNKEYTGVAVNYEDGSLCDIFPDKSRSCRVIYVCDRNSPERIAYSTEVGTCAYELVFVSAWACDVSGLDRATGTQKICCFAANGTDIIPHGVKALQKKQNEHHDLSVNENMIKVTTIDGHQVFIKLFQKDGKKVKVTNEMLSKMFKQDESHESSKNLIEHEIEADFTTSLRPVDLSLSEQNTLNSFLNGYAVHGRSHPFWAYEFCYNKYIVHYHEDVIIANNWNITLGLWNEQKHIEWYQQNVETSTRLKGEFTTLFYTSGSICEEINQARTVKVKLICKNTNTTNNVEPISSTLEEEDLCSYILVLSSRIFCHDSSKLDDNGIPITEELLKL